MLEACLGATKLRWIISSRVGVEYVVVTRPVQETVKSKGQIATSNHRQLEALHLLVHGEISGSTIPTHV